MKKRKENRPPYFKCHGECRELLPFTEEYFDRHKLHKYGLREICKICTSKKIMSPSYCIKSMLSLLPTDKAEMTRDGISVLCKKCGKRYCPTAKQIRTRLESIYGNVHGGNFFYCCDKCKEECPDFNFNINGIHPLSDLYIAPSDRQKVRSCQGSSKKAIMDIQMDEFGYHYCEVCGEKHELDHKPMELHHTDEVAKCGLKAITSAGHMITCYGCHKKITKGILST